MITLERYTELKQKDYKNLKADERKEYSEGLKKYGSSIKDAYLNEAKGENRPDLPIATKVGMDDPKGAPDDTLVLKRSELEKMFEEMLNA
jgi:hypothetical protein